MCLHKMIIFCKVDVILIRMVTISIINNVKMKIIQCIQQKSNLNNLIVMYSVLITIFLFREVNYMLRVLNSKKSFINLMFISIKTTYTCNYNLHDYKHVYNIIIELAMF